MDRLTTDLPRLGYFYTMDFLVFLRIGYTAVNDKKFGHSDDDHTTLSYKGDQIWLEARYPSWWDSIFAWSPNLIVSRCDGAEAFRIQRKYSEENGGSWTGHAFCSWYGDCEKKFDVYREKNSDLQDSTTLSTTDPSSESESKTSESTDDNTSESSQVLARA